MILVHGRCDTMPSYYVAGNVYNSDDICHFGILGQKWGIRRFQNPDGTLTPAGRERYGSAKEQEKLANDIRKGRYGINKTAQVKHAAANLKKEVSDIHLARKHYDDELNKFYYNDKLLDEWTEKAADVFLKDYPDIAKNYKTARIYPSVLKDLSDREVVKWLFKHDDWGQGDYDPLTVFMKSGDKRAESLINAEKEVAASESNLAKASRQYAKEFLGDYGDQDYKITMSCFPNGLKRKVEDTLANIIFHEARAIPVKLLNA